MTKYSSAVVTIGYLLYILYTHTCDAGTVHKSSAFRLMFLTRTLYIPSYVYYTLYIYYTTRGNIRFKQTRLAGLLRIHKVFLAPVLARPSESLYYIMYYASAPA